MRPKLTILHDLHSINPQLVLESDDPDAPRRPAAGTPLTKFTAPGHGSLFAARVVDVWAEYPLDKGWTVAYRLATRHGLPVIGEVRVYPSEPGGQPGTWSAEALGVRARVPGVGVTARLLRMRLGEHERSIRAEVRHLREHPDLRDIFGAELASFGIAGHERPARAPSATTTRRGRRRTSDETLVRFAAAYDKAAGRSARPVQDVARRLRTAPATVRNFIFRARQRGILESTTAQGRPGGGLTKRGKRLLGRLRSPALRKRQNAKRKGSG